MKIFQQEIPAMYGTTLREGVADCLPAGRDRPRGYFMAKVSIRTACRDPLHAGQQLEARAGILTAAAGETKPANDPHQAGV
jgi:hypothetical protein